MSLSVAEALLPSFYLLEQEAQELMEKFAEFKEEKFCRLTGEDT